MVTLAGITVKVMPESPEVDLGALKTKGEEVIRETYGEVKEIRVTEVPIAFGLKALEFIFIVDEAKGSDVAQERLAALEHVASATCTGFQRLT
jgi:translation elongation factor aEF-1 beta